MPTRPFELPDPAASRDDDAAPGPLELFRFARKAVRRRVGVALVVLLAGLSAVAGYLALATPRYRTETRVLAQPQQAFASIARASGTEEHPTYAAWELIHRRENLVQLVTRAGLLEKPPTPGLLDRAWDRFARFAVGAPGEDDPLEQLVRVLDRELKVETGDSTITIRLDWASPQQGYQIVDGALQTFLAARRAQEVTSLDEALAILRGRAGRLRAELTLATDETRDALERASRRSPRRSPPDAAAAGAQRAADDEELARVKSALDAKRRAIGDVEEYRRRRLTELAAQYDAKRALYTEDHPDMVSLRADIAALGRDTRQLTALRAEEQQLQGAYDDLAARQPRREVASPLDGTTAPAPEAGPNAIEQSDRVREARRRYEDVLQSLNQAQVELDTARSAFGRRYQIVWPAEVARRPVSPKLPLVLALGAVASIVAALLAAVLVEWRSGTLVERWQIEAGLGLPLLGEVRRAR
jgi:uncharacterized protein involved in exopolysaccharide biosynthesis